MSPGGVRLPRLPTAGLRRPPRLRRGDRIAVVAPSGPVDGERLAGGVGWLRAEGFGVVLGAHVLARGGHGLPFLAGDDEQRAADLTAAWLDPDVAAVLCARGGDGAPRLLDRLDWVSLAGAPPKVLAGLSDITVLHQAVAARLGLATLWSPMPANRVLAGPEPDPASRSGLLAALLGDEPVRLAGSSVLRPGRASGPVVGGTLSLLAAMMGTPECVPAGGAIAVLEDVNEEPYRVERMLTALRRAGWFDGVAGVVLGDWVGCGDPAELGAVFADRLGDLGVPVLAGVPFGHGPVQLTVPLGVPAVLDTDEASLAYAGPALA